MSTKNAEVKAARAKAKQTNVLDALATAIKLSKKALSLPIIPNKESLKLRAKAHKAAVQAHHKAIGLIQSWHFDHIRLHSDAQFSAELDLATGDDPQVITKGGKCFKEVITTRECAGCGKPIHQGEYAELCDAIQNRKPTCSTKCRNKVNKV